VGDATDEGVDGLEPQGPQAALVADIEPSVRGPSFRKTIADENPQRRIFLEYGFTPPAQLIGSGGVKRRITPWAGRCVAVPAIRWFSLVGAPGGRAPS